MKLFISLFVYTFVIMFYFFAIKFFDAQNEEFAVVLFDYPRQGAILCLVFFLANAFSFFKNQKHYFKNGSYPFVFFWLPFTVFLIITAFLYFYGFVSIGAPFKQNVFINLFLSHTIAFVGIKIIWRKCSKRGTRDLQNK